MSTPASCRLLANRQVAKGQRLLTVKAPDAFARAHDRPGQYCTISISTGRQASFALASPPTTSDFEFLLNEAGAGKPLCHLSPGATLQMSHPQGPGFDLDRAAGRDVVFVATGTGIAPIRRALECSLTTVTQGKQRYLFYGARDPDSIVWREDLERWRAAGVVVRLVYSRSKSGDHHGYVQEALRQELPDPAACAFVCAAHREVAEDLTHRVRAHGGLDSSIITNL